MASMSRMFIARPAEGEWEKGRRGGRLILYTLAFTAAAVSLASVAWASGQIALFMGMVVVTGVGYIVSSIPSSSRFRLSYLVYPAVIVAVWLLRGELLTIFVGGSLFPMAKLLAVLQVMVSFNLRSLRSLYDSLLLSMSTILIVSEGALSFQFGVFLLAFGVASLAFLSAAYPVGELQRLKLVASAKTLGVIGPVLGIVVLTLGTAVAAFLLIPQTYRVLDAGPLPSRLDLTTGKPPSLLDSAGQGSAPDAGVLPSRDEAASQSPDGDAGPSDAPSAAGAPGGSQDGSTEPAAPADAVVDTGISAAGPTIAAASSRTEIVEYATLGYTGEDERDVVMYVRSPLASYWRGEILEEYDGRGWVATDTENQLEVGQQGVLRFGDARSLDQGNGRYVQSFYPRVTQPNAVFTGYSPGYVAVQDPVEGRGRAAVEENLRRLDDAESYRVVSSIPGLSPEMLRFDSVDTNYLVGVDIPAVPDRVKNLARAITADALTDYDMAAALEQYLLLSYDYDLRVGTLPRSSDVVDHFLFERQAGYCSQFATTMAVMARLVGLPARVAAGYLPGEYNSLTGAHTVRLSDAHAWVEIKFVGAGWVPFDPTPRPDSPWALDVGAVEATRGLQQVMRSQLKDFVTDGPSAALGGLTGLAGARSPWLVWGPTLAVIAALGYVLIRRRGPRAAGRHWAGYSMMTGADRDAVRKAYGKALRVLVRKGYPARNPDEGPMDYLEALHAQGLPVPPAFESISRRAAVALYDPSPMADLDSDELRTGLKELRSLPRLAP